MCWEDAAVELGPGFLEDGGGVERCAGGHGVHDERDVRETGESALCIIWYLRYSTVCGKK